ncbi:tyrosine-type recombinase/integrase [Enterovirga sp.]|uniref:tyrosine-type recombinase/integrase n=1 Tax=Enterovirga sp. TaxID=2026350 RepID=UPI003FA547B0
MPFEAATTSLIRTAVEKWREAGLSPGTINKRVSCLGLLGAPISWLDPRTQIRRSCSVPPRKTLKWWLRPEDEAKLTSWVSEEKPSLLPLLLHILWTTRTGLRVEETLRLRRRHFMNLDGGNPALTVPGTKTTNSGNVTLPLSREAAEVARLCFTRWPAEDRLIPLSYWQLWARWEEAREFLGLTAEPLATLRALRRSAARHLHTKRGMPLDMLRMYLRHSDVRTTMEYLRLTGGYSQRELRRFL